jgi:hypothetical protein
VAVFDVKEVDAAVTQQTHDGVGGDASSDSSANPVVVAVAVVVASWMTSMLETWVSYGYYYTTERKKRESDREILGYCNCLLLPQRQCLDNLGGVMLIVGSHSDGVGFLLLGSHSRLRITFIEM